MRRLFSALAFVLIAAVLMPNPTYAATLDLGGFRIRLPSVKPSGSAGPSASLRSHPRWFTSVQDGHSYATNSQGIWITYDDSGALVFQMELTVPAQQDVGDAIPIDIRVNGRPFAYINGIVANPKLIVVKGGEIDALTQRLKTGRTVSLAAAGNVIETHLRGSSAAIRDVEAAAANQRRLYAMGQVPDAANDNAKAKEQEGGVKYFLPGVSWQDTGAVVVNYFIAQDRGLVLRLNFAQIRADLGPGHEIDMLPTEARRCIALLRKGEEWTQIAKDNRVGLFSKRIGFFDNANAGDQTNQGGAGETATNMEQSAGSSLGAGAGQATPQPQPQPAESMGGKAIAAGLPADFLAINFNSYESGDTSVQIEHAVRGFSRRFNFLIPAALELADVLEATIKKAEFDLESREFTQEQKSDLFQ